MTNKEITELKKKVGEFFCDPAWSTNKYRQLWIKNNLSKKVSQADLNRNNPDYYKVRFSPLYNLLRDLLYCLKLRPIGQGKFEIYKIPKSSGPANLAAGLLFGVVCEMMANIRYMKTFSSKTTSVKDRRQFNKNYLGLNREESDAIRFLRDSLTHAYYGLMCFPVAKPDLQYYGKNTKILFELNSDSAIAVQKVAKSRNYSTVDFIVNPDLLLKKVAGAHSKLRDDILNQVEPNLSSWFLREIRRDHWIRY